MTGMRALVQKGSKGAMGLERLEKKTHPDREEKGEPKKRGPRLQEEGGGKVPQREGTKEPRQGKDR